MAHRQEAIEVTIPDEFHPASILDGSLSFTEVHPELPNGRKVGDLLGSDVPREMRKRIAEVAAAKIDVQIDEVQADIDEAEASYQAALAKLKQEHEATTGPLNIQKRTLERGRSAIISAAVTHYLGEQIPSELEWFKNILRTR